MAQNACITLLNCKSCIGIGKAVSFKVEKQTRPFGSIVSIAIDDTAGIITSSDSGNPSFYCDFGGVVLSFLLLSLSSASNLSSLCDMSSTVIC